MYVVISVISERFTLVSILAMSIHFTCIFRYQSVMEINRTVNRFLNIYC